MESQQSLIKFEDVSKKYGTFAAVSHLNLDIHQNEILGFLGPNGAGKTTTIKMLAGLLTPTEGKVWVKRDQQWVQLTTRTRDKLASHMGFLIETPTFYEHMSPRKILAYFARLCGYPREKVRARVEEVIQFIGLMDWIDRPVKEFSKGMRQRLGIVASIIHDPEFVVLDEPQTGLDPQGQKEMRDFILHLKATGKTIFLSSHILYEISEIADRVAVIAHGNLVAVDTLANLEQAQKHSVIKLEILPAVTADLAEQVTSRYNPLIGPLTGTDDQAGAITFNATTKQFEITFDGSPETQHAILKTLIDGGLEVTEFSVPKASLLEDLYLNLVRQESENTTSAPPDRSLTSPGGVEFFSNA